MPKRILGALWVPGASVTLGGDSGPFHFYSLEEATVTSMNPKLRRPFPSPSPSLLPALPPHVSYSGFGAKSLLAEVEDSLGLG